MPDQPHTLDLDDDQRVQPATPYHESGSLLKTRLVFGFGQLLAAAGAIIAFLGFGEQTWIVRTYRFLNSHEAAPVISVGLWLVGGTILWWRAKRKKIEGAVMAALLPNRVAKLTGPIHPTIQTAIDQAIETRVLGSQSSAARRPPPPTKGL